MLRIPFSIIFTVSILSSFAQENRISPYLITQLETNESANFIVVLDDQLRLDATKILGTKTEKAQTAFDLLYNHSKHSQKRIKNYLNSEDIEFHSLFIVNALIVNGNLKLMNDLLLFDEVRAIAADPIIENDLNSGKNPYPLEKDLLWGLDFIDAEVAWEQGFKGQGVVIGGQDTGFKYDHPALIQQYRGTSEGKADHNFNWHDAIKEISILHNDSIILPENNPCGLELKSPCDDHGHGTHTMGIMVGEDETRTIGVAPEAKWIGCRNMERGFGKPSTYLECFEWFLAPTDTFGLNPDPALAPHIINNSWSCPEIEGCDATNWNLLETAVNNLRASGVLVVVSAGNEGSVCSKINSPAAMFEGSFVVGALNEEGLIAPFSSWGPVSIDGSFRIKPDVVAPGVNIYSAHLNDDFRNRNGTSMAGPHVAGMAALLISAEPALAGQVDKIEDLIKISAIPQYHESDCDHSKGNDLPNHVYGFGSINVSNALDRIFNRQLPRRSGKEFYTKVYPNPSSGVFILEAECGLDNSVIYLHDYSGKLIFQQEYELGHYNKLKLDLSSFTSGLYSYLIKINDNVWSSGKIILH